MTAMTHPGWDATRACVCVGAACCVCAFRRDQIAEFVPLDPPVGGASGRPLLPVLTAEANRPRAGKPPPCRQTGRRRGKPPPRWQTGARAGKPPPRWQTATVVADRALRRQAGFGLANRRCAGNTPLRWCGFPPKPADQSDLRPHYIIVIAFLDSISFGLVRGVRRKDRE